MAKDTPYVDVQNLSKSFGALQLFDNISFSIAEGQRVGLVAKNGTGKSTLLAVLAGKKGCDSGDIVFRRDLRVGFLEQSPRFDPDESVLDACFNHQGDPDKVLKAKQVLTQLKIRDLNQPMRQLSGGQQKRVALANVLLTEPDLLILDEPTNHLDLEMIEWLEGYLSRGNRTLLMVTHDRFFLDRVCSVILELDDRTVYTYRGNYAYYLEKRQERIDARRAEIARANNLYRTELEWMRRMPQARGHKARYREEAFYELEKVAKQRMEERQLRLKASNVYIGSKIFECQYISKRFDDVVILKDFYYNFSRFEKMGIVGNNGTGKSTFIKMLLSQVQPDEGRIVIGETVRFGYFSQEGLQFDEQMKVIDVITAIADYVDLGSGKRLTASQLLQYFLFTPEQQHNYVYKLSGGERRKLYLCTVLMKNPNFLVLDEPTNDLDIVTMQILEEYLQDFPGCVIVVSHDRYFLDNVCTKIWEVSFQTMTTYKGNFSAYLPQKEAADALRQKQHDADVALAEKLQDYVDRNLVRASTTKMAQSRRRQLEKLEITEAPKDETNQLKFRFEYDVEPWNELVMLKNLSIKIGERTLLEPFTYTVCRGQRLIIAGPNGAGKSTLMQVLDGKRRPSGGMVRLGTGARPSIFAQQQNRLGQGRVIDVIWNKYPRMTELEVRSHLAKLGFRGDTVFKPCEALSGGELARLRFAEIVLERPNLLFLDEPTNHLDIYTRENLTEALMAYTGTLLLVTHDRHLMNSLACPILYLEDGKAVLYPSYDALMGRTAPVQAAQKAAEPAKTGYGKEQRRRRAELRAKIKACEDEMEACGAREVELDNEINSPEVYNDPDLLRQKSDELSDLRFHQEELFAAWEAAMEEQEAYEQTQQPEE